MSEDKYDFAKELTDYGLAMMSCADAEGEEQALRLYARLVERMNKYEVTLKKIYGENKQLKHDLAQTQILCKQHYDVAQEAMRLEMKLEKTSEEKFVRGVLSNGTEFKIPRNLNE